MMKKFRRDTYETIRTWYGKHRWTGISCFAWGITEKQIWHQGRLHMINGKEQDNGRRLGFLDCRYHDTVPAIIQLAPFLYFTTKFITIVKAVSGNEGTVTFMGNCNGSWWFWRKVRSHKPPLSEENGTELLNMALFWISLPDDSTN